MGNRGVTVRWVDEKGLYLLFTFHPSFTADDYKVAVRYSRDLVNDKKPSHFHVIGDLTRINNIPPFFIAVMQNEYSFVEEGFSYQTVIVGASTIIRYLVSILGHMFSPHQFHFTETIDDAVDLLKQQ